MRYILFLLLINSVSFAQTSHCTDVEKRMTEGKLSEQKGDFISAEKVYKSILAVDSNNSKARVALSNLYHIENKYELALAELNKVLVLDQKNADAYFVRANIYTDLGMQTSALTDYSNAINIDPTMFEAYLSRGFVYAQMEYFNEAIRDFSIAIQIDKEEAVAYYSFIKVQGGDKIDKSCAYASEKKLQDIKADMVFNTFCF